MTDAAAIRREQRVRELRAASIRALSGQGGLRFRGPALYRGPRLVPMPAAHLHPPSERGAADGMALRLRHNDPDIHRESLPEGTASRLVFEMLEQFRVESLVPQSWLGVRRNLTDRFRRWSQEFEASRSIETSAGLLLYTVAQVCRARITADPIAEATQDLIEPTRYGLTPAIGSDLAALRRNRFCQRTFAMHARTIAMYVADLPDLQAGPDEKGHQREQFQWLFDVESDEDIGLPVVPGPGRKLGGEGAGYRVFTRTYDETRDIATLVRPALLGEYRERIDRAVEASGVGVRTLGRQLTQLLAEPHRDGWEGGRDTGFVDGRRLAQLVTTNERNVFRAEQLASRSDSVVSFLIDCSGSMKACSEPVTALVDLFVRALELAGAGSEVLGFTTASWNGGRARRDWMRAGRPRNPGRLNDVRHLVVKSADTSWRSARPAIAGLLKLDLYREGVDGEAVQWAQARLAAHDVRRRILVVISDGSPMDGATALANGEHYLDHHLRDVLAATPDVEICALGVGLDLSTYYDRCTALDLTEGITRRVVTDALATIAQACHRRAGGSHA
jgi:cobaltochelatase CobT